MRRFAESLVRRRRAVLAGWGLLLIACIVVGSGVAGRLSTSAEGSHNTEAGAVANRLGQLGVRDPDVIGLLDGEPVASDVAQRRLAQLTSTLNGINGVRRVDTATTSPLLVSQDGQGSLVAVSFAKLTKAQRTAATEATTSAIKAAGAPHTLVGGAAVLDRETVHQSERDLRRAEFISLPIVLVLAVVIFSGLLAASLPLAIALVSIPGALAILSLLTRVINLHLFALNAATMLGLGLAIDYALLLVNRFRDERARGFDIDVAIHNTVATAGVTVAFSGLTVAVSLLGFVVFDNDVFRSIGIGGIGVVLFAMLAALTLLPALLATVGHRIRPKKARAHEGRHFHRVASLVQRHAALVALAVVAVLVVMGLPFVNARLQIPGAESLPRSLETRQLYDVQQARFAIGGGDPISVIAPIAADAAGPLLARIQAIPGVRGAQLRPTTDQSVTVIAAVPEADAQSATAERIVQEIRAFDGEHLQVGGPAARLIDQRDALFARLPWSLAVMAAATFVLLFLLTGSVLIPIKAIVMNLLSLTATFGVLVWGFQEGHLRGVLGFDHAGSLALWLPFLVFFLAFGLSMDYEVFLLSRIKEEWDRTHDNDRAVALGLQRSGRIITSAALLIAVVFAAFATGDAIDIKALGVGLTLAIVLDATVVRTLLVPATMKLLGAWNWWAPGPLRAIYERFGLHEPPDDHDRAIAGDSVDRERVGV